MGKRLCAIRQRPPLAPSLTTRETYSRGQGAKVRSGLSTTEESYSLCRKGRLVPCLAGFQPRVWYHVSLGCCIDLCLDAGPGPPPTPILHCLSDGRGKEIHFFGLIRLLTVDRLRGSVGGASVAQWQSSGFVNHRLGVRLPSLAPSDFDDRIWGGTQVAKGGRL